jgi:hypothetical protein
MNKTLPNLLRTIRKSVQNAYNVNPNDPALIPTSEYLFGLCAPYSQYALGVIANQGQAIPVITGPTNQSVNAGQNATFSVSVVSALPVTYQWYDTFGNPIIGATGSSYTVVNALVSQSGSTFFVKATNAAGVAVSNTATLTVTATITGYLYYNTSDPGPTLQANSDPFSYQESYSITHNASISVPIPSAATPNMFLIFKIPSTESAKTAWINGSLNFGSFPDSVFQTPITFGGFTYYYTRLQATMDSTTPFVMS